MRVCIYTYICIQTLEVRTNNNNDANIGNDRMMIMIIVRVVIVRSYDRTAIFITAITAVLTEPEIAIMLPTIAIMVMVIIIMRITILVTTTIVVKYEYRTDGQERAANKRLAKMLMMTTTI